MQQTKWFLGSHVWHVRDKCVCASVPNFAAGAESTLGVSCLERSVLGVYSGPSWGRKGQKVNMRFHQTPKQPIYLQSKGQPNKTRTGLITEVGSNKKTCTTGQKQEDNGTIFTDHTPSGMGSPEIISAMRTLGCSELAIYNSCILERTVLGQYLFAANGKQGRGLIVVL